jgi:hypothetical protein
VCGPNPYPYPTNDMTDESDHQRTDLTRRRLLRAAGAAGAVSVSAGAASAQEQTPTPTPGVEQQDGTLDDPRTTATATATATASDDGERQVLAELGDALRVLEYRIKDPERDDGQANVWVRLEADRPAGLVLSDIFSGLDTEDGNSGVRRVEQKRLTVSSGKTWLKMPASVYDDEYVAVGVATTGGAITISNGLPEKKEREVSLPVGVGIGVATAITGTGAAAWSKYHDEEDAPTSAYDDDGGWL